MKEFEMPNLTFSEFSLADLFATPSGGGYKPGDGNYGAGEEE